MTKNSQKSAKDLIDREKLPRHVAIIMDGNGRWAQKRGNKRIYGHRNAVAAVRDTVEAAAELGIGYLTLYAFSTENWKRPRTEVDALMSLLVSTMNSETKTLMDNNVRLLSIGSRHSLPGNVQDQLQRTVELTSHNTGLNLVLALSYSSRWEIMNALQQIAKQVESGKLKADDINSTLFEQNLSTAGMPEPELLIRTSGEYRLSNFLLWQIAYTELFFTKTLWPDFRREDLYEALYNYQCRERRFGKTTEQLRQTATINS
ncbi:MAG: isoprenyl transferase [Bacteroidales bacterium]|nr:isoprenyl transferase [Bacteroidales bacterium]MBN2764296.1 isoprenyl transferase [Bacteroidales bacterium]